MIAFFTTFFKRIQKPYAICLSLGALTITGYAPFYFYPSTLIALAGFFYFLQKANTVKQASGLAYCFGLGFFSAGVSWIYVSLHDYGSMPFLMAAFATFTFCAFLALFTAMVGWLSFKLKPVLLAAPFAWLLMEWIRSWIFTGFPWLNIGYSQVPDGPLAGFAPIVGVYGISLLVALTASSLVLLIRKSSRRIALLGFIILWVSGSLLKQVNWTTPVGKPISVALVQGNIAQDMKWQPEVAQQTLDQYLEMILSTKAQLIVLPETALPILSSQIPNEYLQSIKHHAKESQGDVLLGIIETDKDEYFNSMISTGSAPPQTYRKSHLVPFGEFIPLKSVFGWIYRDWLNMPLTDMSRGDTHPHVMNIAGQRVAVNICYEDVYGEEIIRQLPMASLLVNASNMAWFGDSLAPDQHLQMSQTRALETGRMMLRATNTGATAIIDPHGNIIQQIPHFTTATLIGKAQGYAGETPYVRWGNKPVLTLLFSSLTILWIVVLWIAKNKVKSNPLATKS